MSDEIKSGGEGASKTPPPDPTVNLKAEMDRKLSNFESVITDLKRSNDELKAKLVPAPAADKSKKLGDLMYEDPDAFVSELAKTVTSSVSSSIQQTNQQTQKVNAVLSEIIRDYPEAQDSSSEFFKKAASIYDSYSPEERTPRAMKLAAKEAADELGVLPVSKRQRGNDDFVGGASGSGTRPSQRQKEGEVDDATLAFAEAIDLKGHLKRMGIKTDDEDVKKRLAERSKRKTWNRYR